MNTVPLCVGIIMDGNRRWAKARGLPKLDGHQEGRKKLKEVTEWIRERKVANLIVFAFSTENWNRESSEVSYLMKLFEDALHDNIKKLGEEGVRIRFVGERERFSKEIQAAMSEVERDTEKNSGTTLWVCLSYGGHAEIAAAAAAAAAIGPVTEESLQKHLWTAEMPDPDIIIRTGGEKRLSNFLPWQSVYSELFFTDTYWPDFSRVEFDSILTEFAHRERRHGT